VNLEEFSKLAASRRAVRRFQPDPIPKETLEALLNCARWAPSGFNLQPTHYFVVQNHNQDQKKKEKMLKACCYQQQVVQAPAVVVFTGDRRVISHNLEQVIIDDEMTEEAETRFRRNVSLYFDQGFGISWLAKLIGAPLLRLFTPMPVLPAVYKRNWLTKQVSLAAMNFMLAAEAAGLATSPIEGFDEWRVKRALGIPWYHVVPIVIPVGYAAEANITKSRFPLEELVHW